MIVFIQFDKMYSYVRFCFILCGLRLYRTAVIEALNESSRDLFCEVFQNENFEGESVQIHGTQRIQNFTQITQSWSVEGDTLHSFKLPTSIPSDIVCVVRSCTIENFHGSCTVFKFSQQRVQSSDLKSFECKCFNENDDELLDDSKSEIVNDSNNGLSCTERDIQNYSQFQNFTRLGKKIVGVGRNYIWQKTDLSEVVASGSSPKDPIIFLKPTSSYLTEGNLIQLPQGLGVIYYELELAVVIGKLAHNVEETKAMDYVAGYALALDMTAEEVLKSSIKSGLPWNLAKGFDGACPIGTFIPKSCIPNPHNVHLSASVNGVTTQSDSTSQMIFKIPQLISYISKTMTLEPNDVILTGTPDGFGQVKSRDIMKGWLNDGLAKIQFVVS
ncbi:Acylpyruvase FAHD1, mitochondrial [Pseudolycoriella hygida]|uniref:oxaloacetate tautomerase n=1 Tax=Pseudolycoriella hygida TaxID=35572 RepID=A0A9Q0RV90_9DIPT|nr:Acylpyruvase FAHD1, mitochondrial [Pseudolycoriella hygida]